MRTASIGQATRSLEHFRFFLVILIVTLLFSVLVQAKNSDSTRIESEEPDYVSFIRTDRPNPFSAETLIAFEITKPAFVEMDVYTVLGDLVKTLVAQQKSEGLHVIRWDGKNQADQNVESGVYVYKIRINNYEKTDVLALLK